MFRSILVPLDGSTAAEAALPAATRLASVPRASLHLILAHRPVPATVAAADVAPPLQEFELEASERERVYLVSISARLTHAGYPPVGFQHVEGQPGPVICEEATRLGSDIIVMATRGLGALGRLWLGSVADYVARHAAVPVLLMPPMLPTGLAGFMARNILVAVDFNWESESVLDAATQLARHLGAHLTLFHVVEPFYVPVEASLPYPMPQDPTIADLRRTDAERRLQAMVDRLRPQGLSVSMQVVVGFSAAGGILDELSKPNVDLVAMTTHGAGGLRRLLMGSVTSKVVHHAAKPVLVVRPRLLPED